MACLQPCNAPWPLQVVLVANSLPAINDVTVAELRSVSTEWGGGGMLPRCSTCLCASETSCNAALPSLLC